MLFNLHFRTPIESFWITSPELDSQKSAEFYGTMIAQRNWKRGMEFLEAVAKEEKKHA